MDDRTAEEWGRVAADLPGWTWTMPWCLLPDKYGRVYRRNWCPQDPGFGFAQVHGPALRQHRSARDAVINPDDPANGGCLLSLLGDVQVQLHPDGEWEVNHKAGAAWGYGTTIGRACIAVAEALGRWPGVPDAG